MSDTPDDSTQRPTPPRSSKAAPPFFGPRTSKDSPETTEPRVRRRSTPLFMPPGSLPPEEKEMAAPVQAAGPAAPEVNLDPPPEIADAPASPIVEEKAAPPALAATDPPPGAPRVVGLRASSYFELENLETPEIKLTAGSDRPAVGGSELQVIEYGDANAELASSTPPGGRPSLDGLELESTELTIELSQERAREKGHAPSDLNVESFWAAEAFTLTPRPSTREIPRATEPAPAVPPPAPPVAPPSSAPPVTEGAAPAPAAPVVPTPPMEATPEAAVVPETSAAPAPVVAPADPPEIDVRRSAIDALRVEEVLPPRSPTPPSVRAVTPRSPVPAFAEPPKARTPAALEALKELEPWAVSAMERPEIAAAIAFELERVARRIRNGELRVRTDVAAPNEESALSAALQAITRTQRH